MQKKYSKWASLFLGLAFMAMGHGLSQTMLALYSKGIKLNNWGAFTLVAMLVFLVLQSGILLGRAFVDITDDIIDRRISRKYAKREKKELDSLRNGKNQILFVISITNSNEKAVFVPIIGYDRYALRRNYGCPDGVSYHRNLAYTSVYNSCSSFYVSDIELIPAHSVNTIAWGDNKVSALKYYANQKCPQYQFQYIFGQKIGSAIVYPFYGYISDSIGIEVEIPPMSTVEVVFSGQRRNNHSQPK